MAPKDTIFVTALVAIVLVSGLGVGFVATHGIDNLNSAPQSNQPYQLTLVITTNNYFNSTIGYQPAYFVLQNGQLESSANITLPAYQLIDLTIINYDDGAAAVAPQYENISGTVGNHILILNDSMVNATEGSAINVNGYQSVSSLPSSDIAHTFTVSGINLNIPVGISATEQASLYINTTGTFQWQCMAACGSGSSGWAGAMDTPGWMAGTITVS